MIKGTKLDFYSVASPSPFGNRQITWTSSQLLETLFTNLVVNFNLQFDHIGCNLLRAISQSKLQYSQQYCNIQGELIINVASYTVNAIIFQCLDILNVYHVANPLTLFFNREVTILTDIFCFL